MHEVARTRRTEQHDDTHRFDRCDHGRMVDAERNREFFQKTNQFLALLLRCGDFVRFSLAQVPPSDAQVSFVQQRRDAVPVVRIEVLGPILLRWSTRMLPVVLRDFLHERVHGRVAEEIPKE